MRVVTVIGPYGSGKPSLAKASSTLDGTKASCLRSRGGGSGTRIDYADAAVALIDIPGGAETLAAIGPALAASDAAILVALSRRTRGLCAPDPRLLEEPGLPACVFVNGIDTAADRGSQIVAALQHHCGHAIVLRQIPMRSEGRITGSIDPISERAWKYRPGAESSLIELPRAMIAREQEARTVLLDTLADLDDHLLEEIVEDRGPPSQEPYGVATRALQHHALLPVHLGAARHGSRLKGQGGENHASASGWDVFRVRLPQASQESLAQSLGRSARFRSQFDQCESIR